MRTNQIPNPYELLFQHMERLESKVDSLLAKDAGKDEILTKNETAKYLKCSVQTISNLVRAGELKCSKIGRNPKFLKSELDRYLDENK